MLLQIRVPVFKAVTESVAKTRLERRLNSRHQPGSFMIIELVLWCKVGEEVASWEITDLSRPAGTEDSGVRLQRAGLRRVVRRHCTVAMGTICAFLRSNNGK